MGKVTTMALFCFKNGTATGQKYSYGFKIGIMVPYRIVQIMKTCEEGSMPVLCTSSD